MAQRVTEFLDRLRRSWYIALLAFVIGLAPSWIPIIRGFLRPRYVAAILEVNTDEIDLLACQRPVKKEDRDNSCLVLDHVRCAVHVRVTNASDVERTIESYSVTAGPPKNGSGVVPFVTGTGRTMGGYWYVSHRSGLYTQSNERMAEGLGDNFFDDVVHKPLGPGAVVSGWIFFFSEEDDAPAARGNIAIERFRLEIHDTWGDRTVLKLEANKGASKIPDLGGGVEGSVRVYSARDLGPSG